MTRAELDEYTCVFTTADRLTNIYATLGISCFRWLKDNCSDETVIHAGPSKNDRLVYFKDDKDAMLFRLRWL